jgi:hypothetical protein
LRAYLERGGSMLMLVEPDYAVDESLASILADAGIRLGDGFVVDPVDHYFTDDQMIAVTKYTRHPITRALALSIYPGARPVKTSDRLRRTARFTDDVREAGWCRRIRKRAFLIVGG